MILFLVSLSLDGAARINLSGTDAAYRKKVSVRALAIFVVILISICFEMEC